MSDRNTLTKQQLREYVQRWFDCYDTEWGGDADGASSNALREVLACLADEPPAEPDWMPECVCGSDPAHWRHRSDCPLRYWHECRRLQAELNQLRESRQAESDADAIPDGMQKCEGCGFFSLLDREQCASCGRTLNRPEGTK